MTPSRLTIDINQLAQDLSLSPEQMEVLAASSRLDSASGRGAVVSAGAGSGKTTTLVASLCHDVLVEGVPPEEILVCTFTRAAAANLLSRSARSLATLGHDSGPLQDLWIGTIDSICSRLLREEALPSGMPLSFSVGSDRDLLPLRCRALEQALVELDREQLLLLAERFDVSDGFFLRMVLLLYERLRLDGSLKTTGAAAPVAEAPVPFSDADRALLEELLEQLERDPDAMAKKNLPNKVRDCREMLRTSDPRAMVNFSHGLRAGELAARANEAKELALAYRSSLIDLATFPLRRALESLLVSFDRFYWEEKRKVRQFDFLDLSLLARDEVIDAKRGRRFRRVYVDEAQDTNALQLSILEGLMAEDGLLMMVGDENQSIYAFRQADVAHFRKHRENPALEQLTLGDNYRSHPLILQAVESVFGAEEELPGELDLIQMVAKQEADQASPFPTPVQLLVLTGDKLPSREEEAAAAIPHIEAALEMLNEGAEEQLSYSDVGILCETNKESRAYADALRVRGVPTLLIQKKGLAETEECRDLLAYLRLVADPSDEPALLRVLTSPFVGITLADLEPLYRRLKVDRGDEKESDLSDRWAVLAEKLPDFVADYRALAAVEEGVANLARLVCETHHFDLALELLDPTGARWRNVEKMIALIAGVERDYDGPSLKTVLARLEAEAETEIDEGQDASLPPGLDAVRVMTVHNAKGDEFPLTVVARLSKQGGNPGQTGVKVFEGKIGMTLGSGMPDSTFERADEHEKAIDAAEERRLYYVAMTRARRHLILVASARYDGDGEPKWSGPASWLVPKLLRGNALPAIDDAQVIETGEARVQVIRLGAITPAALSELAITRDPGESPVPVVALPLGLVSQAFSYSSLAAWDQCSMRGHFELKGLGDYRLRDLPGYVSEGAGGMGGTEFGRRVHRILSDCSFSEEIPFKDHARVRELFSEPESRQRAEQFLDLVDASPLRRELSGAKSIKTEVRFDLVMGGQLTRGIIDLMAEQEDEVVVVDWKTGVVEEFEAGYVLQLRLYALAVLRAVDPPEKVRAITFHADGSLDSEEFLLAKVEELEAELAREVRRIVGASRSNPSVGYEEIGPYCDGCPGLRGVCPLAKATYLQAAPA